MALKLLEPEKLDLPIPIVIYFFAIPNWRDMARHLYDHAQWEPPTLISASVVWYSEPPGSEAWCRVLPA